jgi:hypothetical protein
MPINECPECRILYCRECPECGRLEPAPERRTRFRRGAQDAEDLADYLPDFDGVDGIDY